MASFKLIFAEDGQQAIDKVSHAEISLVLLDMEMPVMDGYQAATEIRKLEHGTAPPIIALTAHQGSKEINKCLDAGCSSYLPKPIRKPELLASISEYIEV